MKTERLQTCTRVPAQPATRSGCGAAEPLPRTHAFKKRGENHVVPIGLWLLEVGYIQITVRDLNFPREINEEGNGSPVQPAQLPRRKHV